MVTKADKDRVVAKLKDKFAKAGAVYATGQMGLTVAEISELRNKLRETEAEYAIAKNTLIQVSAKGTNYEEMIGHLQGPTALLFCYGDQMAPAGIVKKFSKESKEKISFKGAFVDGATYDAVKADALASLPSKEVLLAQIAGMLVASPSSIAYILKELGEKEGSDKKLQEFVVAEAKSSEDSAEGDSQQEKKEETE